MQIAARPYVKVSIALVGASALAIAPITAAPPELTLPTPAPTASTAVALAANPVEFYAQVIGRTLGNVDAQLQEFLADPAPILMQVIANQASNLNVLFESLEGTVSGLAEVLTTTLPTTLEAAFEQLSEGSFEGFVNTLLGLPLAVGFPVIGLLNAPVTALTQAVGNVNKIVQQALPILILAAPLGVLAPINSTVGAFGAAVQNVIDAVGAGDLTGLVEAIVNFPGVIADGFFNGGYGGSNGLFGTDPSLMVSPVSLLLSLRTQIANLLKPSGAGLMAATAGAPELTETNDSLQDIGSIPGYRTEFVQVSASVDGSGVGEGTEGVEGTEVVGEGSGEITDGEGPGPESLSGGAGNDAGEEGEEGEEEEEEESGDDVGLDGLDDEGEDGDDGTTANGGTDLSGGNKAEPGQTGGSDANAGGDGNDEETTSTVDADTGDNNTGDTGGDAGGDGSDE
jgi:hypothetical protein